MEDSPDIQDKKSWDFGDLLNVSIILIVVVSTLGFLLSSLPAWLGKKQIEETRDSLLLIERALSEFEADRGKLPSSLEELSLSEEMAQIPTDAWKKEFRYIIPPVHNLDYDLFSLGPDGIESEDDIRNW